ncbi:aliphatic sulfonate ABC transporter substrate-binding protein [Aminipila butyrica]|nr:aliphatic sulfonate ABC transporter substrate-binding protein [Aminipila butyrica]
MKKFIAVFMISVLAVLTLVGCGTDDDSTSGKTENNSESGAVLRIAAQPYPLYTPVYVAQELGYLQEEFEAVGATYEWQEFKSGPLVNEAVAAGEADLGFMADLPAIIAKSTGQPIEIVSNIAYGEKGLAVLVKADSTVKSIADLKGKKIAYATGSYAQHLLALLLSNEDLTLDDVQTINLGASDQPAALANGEVDAIVIWEQYISKLTSDGTAKVLADGTGVKRGNMITYVVSDYAKANPDVIKAYIRALNRADELLASDPDKAAEAVAADFGVDTKLMRKIISNFTYSTELTAEDIAEITKVKDFSLDAGIISKDVDINSFINTEYVKAAE